MGNRNPNTTNNKKEISEILLTLWLILSHAVIVKYAAHIRRFVEAAGDERGIKSYTFILSMFRIYACTRASATVSSRHTPSLTIQGPRKYIVLELHMESSNWSDKSDFVSLPYRAEPSRTPEETHFDRLCPWSYSFGHHQKLTAIMEGWKVDQLANWELCLPAQLPLHHNSLVQLLDYSWHHTKLPVHIPSLM